MAQQQLAFPPGYARVWILRQYEPSESLRTPVMYINGASIGASQPGTIFYRDLPAGAYQVTVDSCTKDVGQDANLNLAPGMQVYLEIQSLSSSMRSIALSGSRLTRHGKPPGSARSRSKNGGGPGKFSWSRKTTRTGLICTPASRLRTDPSNELKGGSRLSPGLRFRAVRRMGCARRSSCSNLFGGQRTKTANGPMRPERLRVVA